MPKYGRDSRGKKGGSSGSRGGSRGKSNYPYANKSSSRPPQEQDAQLSWTADIAVAPKIPKMEKPLVWVVGDDRLLGVTAVGAKCEALPGAGARECLKWIDRQINSRGLHHTAVVLAAGLCDIYPQAEPTLHDATWTQRSGEDIALEVSAGIRLLKERHALHFAVMPLIPPPPTAHESRLLDQERMAFNAVLQIHSTNEVSEVSWLSRHNRHIRFDEGN